MVSTTVVCCTWYGDLLNSTRYAACLHHYLISGGRSFCVCFQPVDIKQNVVDAFYDRDSTFPLKGFLNDESP